MTPSRTPLIRHAIEVARAEVEEGRSVMVLFPSEDWTSQAMNIHASRGDPIRGIYMRCTTNEFSLRSVAVDTLILVGTDTRNWNANGERLAREKLRISRDPRVRVLDAVDILQNGAQQEGDIDSHHPEPFGTK